MKFISSLTISLLAAATTALDARNSGIPPFHLMVFGNNPATNGSFVQLRPSSGSSSGPTAVVVDKTSPTLIAQVRNGEVQSLAFDKTTKKYKRLGPIGGLRKGETTDSITRQAFFFREVAGAGAQFNKSSKGWYLDAPPTERAYFLYHRVKPEIVNGFLICKNTGQDYYSLYYDQYKNGSPHIKGCEFVGLAVQEVK